MAVNDDVAAISSEVHHKITDTGFAAIFRAGGVALLRNTTYCCASRLAGTQKQPQIPFPDAVVTPQTNYVRR